MFNKQLQILYLFIYLHTLQDPDLLYSIASSAIASARHSKQSTPRIKHTVALFIYLQ